MSVGRQGSSNDVHRYVRGFSLVEALVAVALLGLGIAGTLSGLSSIGRAEIRAQEKERMNLLAAQKMDEVLATNLSRGPSTSGEFETPGNEDYEWELITGTTGIENLNYLRVEVTKGQDESLVGAADSLIYIPAETGAGGTN